MLGTDCCKNPIFDSDDKPSQPFPLPRRKLLTSISRWLIMKEHLSAFKLSPLCLMRLVTMLACRIPQSKAVGFLFFLFFFFYHEETHAFTSLLSCYLTCLTLQNIWTHDLNQIDRGSCMALYLVYTAGKPNDLWDNLVSFVVCLTSFTIVFL